MKDSLLAPARLHNNVESLHAAINLLCHQKFRMSATDKACVSSFIARNTSGKVKVEFVTSESAYTDRLEIRQVDKVIILTHSSNKADTIYVMVTANKAPEEVPVEQQSPKLSDADRAKIIQGTAQHVDTLVYTRACFDIGTRGQGLVADFLEKQNIQGRIRALPCAMFPEGISVQDTVFLGDCALELAFVANQINCERHPHVLWVRYTQDRNVLEKARKVVREEDFRKFWKSNELPDSLLDEAISAVDVMQRHRVLVHKTAKSWLDARMKENETVTFFGQNPSDGLDPKKPIGYVIGGKLVITNPEAKYEFKVFEFI